MDKPYFCFVYLLLILNLHTQQMFFDLFPLKHLFYWVFFHIIEISQLFGILIYADQKNFVFKFISISFRFLKTSKTMNIYVSYWVFGLRYYREIIPVFSLLSVLKLIVRSQTKKCFSFFQKCLNQSKYVSPCFKKILEKCFKEEPNAKLLRSMKKRKKKTIL